MSGNFVQRGDVALMDKFTRAKLAIYGGADLVIELPVPYSLATAEIFSYGAAHLLNALGCVNELSFGSECGNLDALAVVAREAKSLSNTPELCQLLELGMAYPNALKKLLERRLDPYHWSLLDGPNNILAIEYLKALDTLQSPIAPFTIRRKCINHDSDETAEDAGVHYASASFIRDSARKGEPFEVYEHFMPDFVQGQFLNAYQTGRLAFIDQLTKVILYKLRVVTPEELRNVPDVAHGLENRFIEVRDVTTLNELFESAKTKRYPYARLKRIIMNMTLGITKGALEHLPPYIRVLALNNRGAEILSRSSSVCSLPAATSLSKLSQMSDKAKEFANLEAHATDVYGLAMPEPLPAMLDYTTQIKKI
jgi:predicted nucleotidyltransferase